MLNILAVFLGGGTGAVARFLTGTFLLHYVKINFPVATFCVNITGCFLIGFIYIFIIEKFQVSPPLKYALTVGFCGGLTTFSTFSFEIFEMIKNNHFFNAALYILLSVIIGIIAVYFGGNCAKLL